jgi:hypothetical protein
VRIMGGAEIGAAALRAALAEGCMALLVEEGAPVRMESGVSERAEGFTEAGEGGGVRQRLSSIGGPPAWLQGGRAGCSLRYFVQSRAETSW